MSVLHEHRPSLLWAVACSARALRAGSVLVVAIACSRNGSNGSSADASGGIATLCARIAGGSCTDAGIDSIKCDQQLTSLENKATALKCVPQWQALLSCWEREAAACSLAVPSSCQGQSVAVDACEQRDADVCRVETNGAECSVACSDFDASCAPDGASKFACTCTRGPRASKTFTASSCGSLTEVASLQCS